MQKQTCRLCLSKNPWKSSSYKSLLNNNGIYIVECLTSIKINEGDGFSNLACSNCWLNIRSAFKIRENILKVDAKLRKTLVQQTEIYLKNDVPDEDSQSLCEVLEDSGEEEIKQEEPKNLKETRLEEDEQELLVDETYLNSLKRNVLSPRNELKICLICREKVKEGQLYNHTNEEHFDTNHVCECGEKFKSVSQYQKHYQELHPDPLRQWRCENCKIRFKHETIYKEHLEKSHSIEQQRPKYIRDYKSFKFVSAKFSCRYCIKIFPTEEGYLVHNDIKHKPKECTICKKKINAPNFKKHMKDHETGPVVCQFCGNQFAKLSLYKFHCSRMHDNRSFPCEKCGKVFVRNAERRKHFRKDHTNERNHTCDSCGKSFFTNKLMSQHINSTHLKLRPYICEHCNKKFSSRYALRTHVRQHTDDKPYRCDLCGEGFRQNVSLRTHKKSKHNIVEEITCYCPICGKGFSSKAAIDSHRRLH